VHGSPSSITVEPDATHSPEALQAPLVQASTEQDVPSGAGWKVTSPVRGSHVPTLHGFEPSIATGVPGWHAPEASHVSLPLQRSKSLQLEPAVRGVWATPLVGSQLSSVHGLPSSTVTGVPAVQLPLWQVSAPLQRLASAQLVPSTAGVWVTPSVGEQASVLQGLPSSTLRVDPAVHVPETSQVSLPLQALPSLHDVPAATGVCVTPLAASQASVVQGLPSSTVGAAPATQAPLASQVSGPLQALPSPHDVPASTGVCVAPVAALHASVVQGLPSSTATWAPLAQVPAWQVSFCVQASPSVQVVPSAFAGFEHAPVAESQVPAL
jgi:hypothetical protein